MVFDQWDSTNSVIRADLSNHQSHYFELRTNCIQAQSLKNDRIYEEVDWRLAPAKLVLAFYRDIVTLYLPNERMGISRYVRVIDIVQDVCHCDRRLVGDEKGHDEAVYVVRVSQ